jgi:hypothetical protein
MACNKPHAPKESVVPSDMAVLAADPHLRRITVAPPSEPASYRTLRRSVGKGRAKAAVTPRFLAQ